VKTAAAAAVMVVAGCTDLATGIGGRPGPEAGLLRGKQPVSSAGVTHVARLTDGITAAPGDLPRTDLTSLFSSPGGHVVYDLGSAVPIRCVALDADTGSKYTLNVSADAVAWQPMLTAATTGEPGIQTRAIRNLTAVGRYVRLAVEPGSGPHAVAELSMSSDCAARWPPPLAVQRGTPVETSALSKWWLFVALASAYVLAYRRKLPDFIKLLVAAPLGIGLALAIQLAQIWPPPPSLRAPLAGGAAIVAAAVAVRVVVSRRRRPR
jgi:hypothetical protein